MVRGKEHASGLYTPRENMRYTRYCGPSTCASRDNIRAPDAMAASVATVTAFPAAQAGGAPPSAPRQRRARGAIALTVLVVSVAACRTQYYSFPPLTATISHVEVRVPVATTIDVIRDTARIRAITTFVNARTTGWRVPPFGVPGGAVWVEFFGPPSAGSARPTPLGGLGACANCFEAHFIGPGFDFNSRRATRVEIEEFARLIGVPISRIIGDDSRREFRPFPEVEHVRSVSVRRGSSR